VYEIFCGKVCTFVYNLMSSQLFKATVIFVMSVCPPGTTRLLPDGFLLSLIFEYFSNIYRENLGFITLTSIMSTLHEHVSIHVICILYCDWGFS
jgi:uncharacterized membrane protein